MYCQRCDKPLTADEATTIDNPGTSGAGATITVCRIPCRPTPHQTSSAPESYHLRYRRAR